MGCWGGKPLKVIWHRDAQRDSIEMHLVGLSACVRARAPVFFHMHALFLCGKCRFCGECVFVLAGSRDDSAHVKCYLLIHSSDDKRVGSFAL